MYSGLSQTSIMEQFWFKEPLTTFAKKALIQNATRFAWLQASFTPIILEDLYFGHTGGKSLYH